MSLLHTLGVMACLAAALFAAALLALRIPPQYDAGVTGVGGSATNKVGFYGLEFTRAGEPYRWTSGYAFVQMPYAFRAAPAYLAEVRLRAENPAGPQPLIILQNERPLATVVPSGQFRVYRMALPPASVPEAELRLALRTTPFRPPENPRPLGVIMSAVILRPAPVADWSLLSTLSLGPALLLLLLRPSRGGLVFVPADGASQSSVLLHSTLRTDTIIGLTLGAALLLLAWRAHPAPLRLEWMMWLALFGAAVAARIAREWPARLGLALLCALAAFSGALWPSWLTDDAFISFRYAQNLVAGNGLVYNVGERVEGYTNFLWTVLAALALHFGADIVVAAYAAGIGLAVALILATYRIGRELLGSGWALVAALLVGTSQSLLVYTARGGGLETGLFTLLALFGSGAYLAARRGEEANRRRDDVVAGLLFALATLTRPEGALLMGLTVVHLLATQAGSARLKFQRATVLLLPFLAVVLPFFAWRFGYYGDLLPNTFYVKTGGQETWLRGLAYLGSFALDFGGPLLLFALAAGFGTQRHEGTRARRPEESFFASSRLRAFVFRFFSGWPSYLLLSCAAYATYVLIVGGDHFPGHRFLVPLVPWLALLVAGGMAWAFQWIERVALLRRLAPIALAVLLVIYSGYALTRSEHYDAVLAGNDESLWLWAEIGWWLHDNAAPDQSVAALGAGAIAFYSERPVIDLLGLTERHIARVPATEGAAVGHEKRDPVYVLDVRRPTYIPRIWDEYFGGAGVLRGRYELITIQTRYGRELELWRLK